MEPAMTVRLVFRPYTDVRRAICTSAPWRTSIRVSPDFVLRRHRSPSFGYQRTRSGSVPLERAGRRCAHQWFNPPVGFASKNKPLKGLRRLSRLRFHYASSLFTTLMLASPLDSLDRVSRRGSQLRPEAPKRLILLR